MSSPGIDLPVWLDESMAHAMTAVVFDNDADVSRWFTAVREALPGEEDWASLGSRIEQRAQVDGFDPSAVTSFLEAAADTGRPAEFVRLVVDHEAELPGAYWSAYWWRFGGDQATESTEESRFDWVRDDQAAALAGAWGADWAEHLGPRLDYRWGADWKANPADHKAHWLADLLPEFLVPPTETPPDETASDESDTASVSEDLAAPAVAEAIAAIPGAEQLSPEEIEAAIAAVTARLEQEAGA